MSLQNSKTLTTIIKNIFLKQQTIPAQIKSTIVQVFRQKIPQLNIKKTEIQEINDYAQQLSKPIVEFKKIQMLAWHGIPDCIRPKIWKYLLKYCLLNDAGNILTRKRDQYRKLIKNYWQLQQFNEDQKKVHRTIEGDVKRIGAQYNEICKHPNIQTALKRILLIWHMRHPQSGYVQGMCDIAIPFMIIFLDQFLPVATDPEKYISMIDTVALDTLVEIEADAYWCMTKMMENVLSNYTQGFGGLQQAYKKVQQKLQKVDMQLYNHFVKQNIDLFAFAFRNISTMLMRMFRPRVAFRLLDTYISFEQQYPQFMIYLLIAILQKFAKKMLKMKFDDLMSMIQNLPTKTWTQSDIEIVIAEAYVYMREYGCKK